MFGWKLYVEVLIAILQKIEKATRNVLCSTVFIHLNVFLQLSSTSVFWKSLKNVIQTRSQAFPCWLTISKN